MTDKPKIENAPGLKWREIKLGWQATWRARADLVARGYPFRSMRLWESTEADPYPSDLAKAFISENCVALQDEMLTWGRGQVPELITYDGTWAALVNNYMHDADSPYRKKEYATRKHYDTLCRRIVAELGNIQIKDTDARSLLRLHERVIAPDKEGGPIKLSMGHAVVVMMRTITTFGATLLKCPHCRIVRDDLRDMRIKNGKPREEALTAEQVIGLRRVAHQSVKPYRHSIALAQSIQFDVGSGMRQKDIIGEWVPISEPGISDTISGNKKWIKGIRAEEIDQNFILRHVTSKRKKLLVADLKLSQMVMEEFRIMAGLEADQPLERHHIPTAGPLVISEQTGAPYESDAFRKAWRALATKAGIPTWVRNMDSRAGGVTEAFESGAAPDDVRKGATHSNISMTERYNRREADAVSRVMEARAASRNKGTPK